jgi:hypothetical protein
VLLSSDNQTNLVGGCELLQLLARVLAGLLCFGRRVVICCFVLLPGLGLCCNEIQIDMGGGQV